MLTVLLILLGCYILYRFLRPQYNPTPYFPGDNGGGMGSMFGGMILGYLLTHYLIDQHQYDMWQNLNDEQLRDTLTSQGILNHSDFDRLAEQATAGTLPGSEDDSDIMAWDNANRDLDESANFDSYDGGGDDFGGFDS